MLRTLRLSLADKCQVLFGGAILLILLAALVVVGLRLRTLVELGPRRRAQDLAELMISGQVRFTETDRGTAAVGDTASPPAADSDADGSNGLPGDADDTARSSGLILTQLDADEIAAAVLNNRFLDDAVTEFTTPPVTHERFITGTNAEGRRFFRYARALRPPPESAAGRPGALAGVLLVEMTDEEAATQFKLNALYLLAAGFLAFLFAIAVFWFITTRLILQPVRVLRGYAERVSDGDLSIRSDINTGDEFEQLSDVFNTMLDTLKSKQDQLTAANRSLDMELIQLAESNDALFEANRLKGEFLANISHELRTPLNSIIGFAEVLQETLAERTGPVDEKRKRYAHHIITSSRTLLDLINDLLDLAKIEAGKMEIVAAPVSISDMCEGLITLITPLADKREIVLVIRAAGDLPTLVTDAGKLQRILFNLLSNAVKFTPPRGRVSMTAEHLPAGDPRDPASDGRIRFQVTDTGPGIAPADQKRIFEKFTQVDNSHTREHQGTGLGLTIARDLAALLRGRLSVASEPGRGATFTLVVPLSSPRDA